jgi:hypothetical protein
MANIKYFSECEPGNTVELLKPWHDGHNSSAAHHFGGTCPVCGYWHMAKRAIERPGSVSNHKCDGRCLSAKGHKCECECGGKNHGRAA